MLSPSITTSGYSTLLYQLNICAPISYCSRSPSPLSPMTPKRRVFGLLGSGTCACCGAPAGAVAPGGADTATLPVGDGSLVAHASSVASTQTSAARGMSGSLRCDID